MIGSERLSQLLCTDTSGGRGDRRRARGRACAESTTRSASAPSVPTRSCTTTSASTARSTASRCTTSASSTRSTTGSWRSACGPASSSASCRATWPAIRRRLVFEYRGIISPPKDWDRWADLISALVRHLMDRYGYDEVLGWDFEVWNEANLEVFWSSTRDEWMQLYDVTAAADQGRRPAARRRRAVVGRCRLGRRPARARQPLRRAGRLRHHAHLRQRAARPTPDPGALRKHRADPVDRVGRHADATSIRSTTASRRRRSCCTACVRRRAAWTRCPTGWPATTSRSSAGRRGCCTAASG